MNKHCVENSADVVVNQIGEFSGDSETENEIDKVNICAVINAIDDNKLCCIDGSDSDIPKNNFIQSRRKRTVPIKIPPALTNDKDNAGALLLKENCLNEVEIKTEVSINDKNIDLLTCMKYDKQDWEESQKCEINLKLEVKDNSLERSNESKGKAKALKDISKWYCSRCPAVVDKLSELQAHHENAHNQPVAFKCSICSKVYSRYRSYSRHVKQHGNPKSFECEICHKTFSQKTILLGHATVHTDERPHVCKHCGKSFKQFSSLYCHIKGHHTEKIKFPCSVCNKEFSTKHTLDSHLKIHSGERNYICDICGKSFVAKGSLDYHILSHNNLKTHICPTCGKAFKTSRLLEKHSTLHTGIKPHRCDVCGKHFREKGALREHSRIHTGAMPYSCEFCGKAFRFKGILTVHRRQHTGERPYSCNDCKKSFTNWANYNKHMKRRHKNEYRPTNVSGRNKYKPPFLTEEIKVETKDMKPYANDSYVAVTTFDNRQDLNLQIEDTTEQFVKGNERQVLTLYRADTERRIFIEADGKILNCEAQLAYFENKDELRHEDSIKMERIGHHEGRISIHQDRLPQELHENCVDVIMTHGFNEPSDSEPSGVVHTGSSLHHTKLSSVLSNEDTVGVSSMAYLMTLPYDGPSELSFFKT